MKQPVLKIHPSDNVLVALKDLGKGGTIRFDPNEYVLLEPIPAKHKFFTQDIGGR